MKQHRFKLHTKWHGDKDNGTSSVAAYDRSHTVTVPGKPELHLITGNPLYGDSSKLNPEDLLVAALSSCHLLSYLYLCAMAGVVVIDYEEEATGLMDEYPAGGGKFTQVTLNPVVTVKDASMVEKAIELHHKAHEICYIAKSVNFEVQCKPVCRVL
jgi:organic hydroperoxide reductase OsmC/OhrA